MDMNLSRLWEMVDNSEEKAMAPHFSTLAWKIPWMEEPGRLQSMQSLRVGYDWATSLSLFTFMHWRRKWQPTPVFLPGESQGRGSLVGCCLWGGTVGHDWSDLAAAAADNSEALACCSPGVTMNQTWLSNWTTSSKLYWCSMCFIWTWTSILICF